MPARINDIVINESDRRHLVQAIERKFSVHRNFIPRFTRDKNSEVYQTLKDEIWKVTHFSISGSTLCNVMTGKHTGRFNRELYNALRLYAGNPYLSKNNKTPQPQLLFWGVNQGLPAGAIIDGKDVGFIPWKKLKRELETSAIIQCPKFIPPNSHVELADFYGKKDWVVHIFNSDNKKIASVWIGSNPENGWLLDGYVRVGVSHADDKWEVYQVLQRWTDGSYRLIESKV